MEKPVSDGIDLRIRHDVDELAEGETIVLTLKDRRIGTGLSFGYNCDFQLLAQWHDQAIMTTTMPRKMNLKIFILSKKKTRA